MGYVEFLIVAVLATTIIVVESRSRKFENLVLEGGGIKGISYIGSALAFAQTGYYHSNHYEFRNISGTSIGCVFGLAIALDIDPQKMYNLALDTDFTDLLESEVNEVISMPRFEKRYSLSLVNYALYAQKLFQYTTRIMKLWTSDGSPGLTNTEKIENWVFKKLVPLSRYHGRVNEFTTMRELEEITQHSLTCFASRIIDPKIMRYSAETTPDRSIREAVITSISLPGLFKPLNVREVNQTPEIGGIDDIEHQMTVDGGIFNNFAIYEYDEYHSNGESSRNYAKTLGLSLHASPANLQVKSTSSLRESCPSQRQQHESLEKTLSECECWTNSQKKYKKRQNYKQTHFSTNFQIPTPQYLRVLLSSLIGARSYLHYSSDPLNVDRIIYLQSPLQLLEFNLTRDKIHRTILCAQVKTLKWFGIF